MYVLKALTTMNDAMIYEHLTRARPGDAFWAGCVTNMLSMAQDEGIVSQQTAPSYCPWENDDEAAKYLFKFCVAIHLNTDEQKFFCLTLMAQKLIALVKEEITPESLDNPQFQEASKEDRRNGQEKPDTFKFTGKEFIKSLASHKGGEITRGLEYFLATGNLVTKNGLGLMQTTGFSVIAERINQLRFVSHFRAIHRGAFFMEMRTTDVRKLRPEAWGFICPVHTPDGAPCGLLNHVTASCRIVTHFSVVKKLQATLLALGMIPHNMITSSTANLSILWSAIKVTVTDDRFLYITEIALIRHSTDPTNCAVDWPILLLGVFEQVYLSVIIDPEEAEPGVTMHQELHPTALFSFADGKANNGVPVHAWRHRADGKMYLLQYPQKPLLNWKHMTSMRWMSTAGTNACVAVISYTGYDMEDAMVINRGSYQRGFAHGCVLKVERINLVERRGFQTSANRYFFSDATIGLLVARLLQLGRIVDENFKEKVHALIQWRIPRNLS
uniref:DNA-directed RNA polymerase n=1 Tax=Ditylenchus dipsaci TaxID=166011 RepID=A0A915EK48_9BILA